MKMEMENDKENDKENIYKYDKLWDKSFLSPEILSTNYDYELITNQLGPSIFVFQQLISYIILSLILRILFMKHL